MPSTALSPFRIVPRQTTPQKADSGTSYDAEIIVTGQGSRNKKPRSNDRGFLKNSSDLYFLNLGCLQSFWSLTNFELNRIAFVQ